MPRIYGDFDVSNFWDNTAYALEEYVGQPITQEMIDTTEAALGYKLPASYVELLKTQNGGTPSVTNHKTGERTSWAKDHVAITGIYGVDGQKSSSLCGRFSSTFWLTEWGYPPIGIYFADCPSAGHDMLCLDYRVCGRDGEPQVVQDRKSVV